MTTFLFAPTSSPTTWGSVLSTPSGWIGENSTFPFWGGVNSSPVVWNSGSSPRPAWSTAPSSPSTLRDIPSSPVSWDDSSFPSIAQRDLPPQTTSNVAPPRTFSHDTTSHDAPSSSPTGNDAVSQTTTNNSPASSPTGNDTTSRPVITSEPTTTSKPTTTSEPKYDLAAQFTVGSPPSICTSSRYSWETKLSVPTGYVMIKAGKSGWGPEGSIWNISTAAGAKLTKMKAACQGSVCSGITGDRLYSGAMKQRIDGSWFMNVTANMQASLMISGLLLQDGSSRLRDTSKKEPEYLLRVLGVPPCGLPIADNCTNRHFQADRQQWKAYQVNDFMESYLKKNDINSYDGFRKKAMEDFEPGLSSAGKICDITNGHFNCLPPDYSACNTDASNDNVRGVIMTTAIVEFTNFMALLYDAVSVVSGRIGDEIDQITTNFWVPAAKQSWTKIMSVMSSVFGIMIAGFVLLQVVLPAAAWTGGLVVAAIAASNAFGMAANVGNLEDPGSTDTQFEQSTGYKIGAQNMLKKVMNGIESLYTNSKTGQDTLMKVIGGGNWVGKEISGIFSEQGLGASSTDWYEKLMVAQFITKALTDNDAYILFIAYGDNVPYNGKKLGFDQETCENHWRNDPSWKYYSACDITFGPDGAPGMSIFTRPSSEGSESKSWADKPLNYHGENITAWDIMSSSIWGHQQHGFGYTFLDQNFTEILSEDGLKAAQGIFQNVAINQPGLYNVPVCVVEDLVYISGVHQVMSDIHDSPASGGYFRAKNPCPCKDYSYTPPDENRETGKFTDFVSEKVRDSFGDGCKLKGNIRWPGEKNGKY